MVRPLVIEMQMKLSAGPNSRSHWRTKARIVKDERERAFWSLRGSRRPKLPVVVTLTRISRTPMDDDNIRGAFKAVRDGIADAYSLADNDPRISFRYTQEQGSTGQFDIRIEVSPA